MNTDLQDVARGLPDYHVDREIGRGEFGIVWAGRHRQLGRAVAIKQLAGPVTSTAEYGSRFRREARILAQLDHPHVVTVYDYREPEELRLFVMEHLPGGSFADRRAAGMSVETAIAATLAAASGLHHVHEQGILHRDVKAENLMFDRRGALKVTDFGIARVDLADATVVNLTHAGEFFGTPAYVSPEQAGNALAEGWPLVGAAADQYSLAAVLYEALSGYLTHDSTGGSLAICTRRMNEEARPLRDVAPAIPPEIEAVVMRALARDPSARFPSTEAFAVALGTASRSTLGPDWLAHSAVQIREAGPILDAALGERVDQTLPTPPAPPGPIDPPGPPDPPAPPAGTPDVQPRRVGLMVGAFVGVLALALGSLFLLTRHDSPTPPPTTPIDQLATPKLHLTEKWSVLTGGDVLSSPAVGDGLMAAGSDDASVYGAEASTGKTRWTYETDAPVRSSPTISSGFVFVGSDDGALYALDAIRGKVRWKKELGFVVRSSPTVAAGKVIVGSDRLYAFDAASGDGPLWTGSPTDGIVSSPAILGDTIVVGSNDHNIYGVGLADGVQRWVVPTRDMVSSSPAIAGGTAYIGGLDHHLYAIDVAKGTQTWAKDLGAAVQSSPTVSGGRVFVATVAGRLVAVNPKQGKVEWSWPAPARIQSSPAVVGDLVVVGCDDGNVYAVDAKTGKLEGAFKTGGPVISSPRVVGSDVVVGSADHKLYRIHGFQRGNG